MCDMVFYWIGVLLFLLTSTPTRSCRYHNTTPLSCGDVKRDDLWITRASVWTLMLWGPLQLLAATMPAVAPQPLAIGRRQAKR